MEGRWPWMLLVVVVVLPALQRLCNWLTSQELQY
jgi:hypothetical protein